MKERKPIEKIKTLCSNCGAERFINPQNAKQVKLCVVCQAKKNQERNTKFIRERRIEERAKANKKISKPQENKSNILNFS